MTRRAQAAQSRPVSAPTGVAQQSLDALPRPPKPAHSKRQGGLRMLWYDEFPETSEPKEPPRWKPSG